ncbi:hypothetical protein L207DRAFT_415193 [Hyaloscypha variabilis F]|uniref:Uncharacterized protein n=1 Tax=Hyaloscypha variabilis (strain UAMH 11265 / GT02V1 / F) TaxID=1149755 RepID=A0A2J6SE94_HYAVF|nr:hypothetical protein L207DRAFT_415193 [Hyaloscypha variabilis F]
MGKTINHNPAPPAYRDDPDHAETASMASAVLLDDVESFPDEELPAYTDTPPAVTPSVSSSTAPHLTEYNYAPPPEPPFSSHDLNYTEYRTRFPNYSTSASDLSTFIREQLQYPATYMVQLYGTHTETRRNGNKETKDKITDFYIRINITHLLGPLGSGITEFLPDNRRGYRGTIIPRLPPSNGITLDEETGEDPLSTWCQKYVSDPSKIKSFTLKREIQHHDTKKLEQLLRSAIADTNYRGHLSISFPKQHEKVVIYSPGTINEWRMTVWIRWVFYLTFLWIFAWPVLFLLTSRYEVAKGIFQYADCAPGTNPCRRPRVMSEVQWFHRWESAIKRAAVARMVNKDGACLDEEYRAATERAEERGEDVGRAIEIPRTGNVFADGAFGLIGQGLRVAEGLTAQRGWGGDC